MHPRLHDAGEPARVVRVESGVPIASIRTALGRLAADAAPARTDSRPHRNPCTSRQ